MAVQTVDVGEARFDWSLVKFLAFPAMSLLVLIEVALGGAWFYAVLPTYLVIALLGDNVLGDDFARRSTARRRVLDGYLYSAVPLCVGVTVLLACHASGTAPGPLAALASAFGLDLASRAATTTTPQLLAGIGGLGLFFGSLVNVAHELVHRTGDRTAWLAGRCLLAHTLDTGFAIEHVYGHHRYVGTARDPATARRGEYVLGFVWRSTLGQIRSAMEIERTRLARRGVSAWSWSNRLLSGQVMSIAIVALVALVGGWKAVLAFLATAVLGKVALEVVNYLEHYGLAREEGKPVRPHHSWNCHNRLSSWLLFNLPRHSDHHMNASRPYYDLRPVPELSGDAPVLPAGYLGCMALALVPPLWRRAVEPRLADWDRRLANEAEVAAARAMAR